MAGNKTNAAKLLIQLGADVNIVTKEKFKAGPIHVAAIHANEDMIRLLHSSGAGINLPLEDGSTPLILAIQFNKVDLVNLLCTLGADVNKTTGSKNEFSPIWFAVEKGIHEIIKTLHKFGADINLAKDDGTTSAHIAAEKNDTDLIRLLADLGANFNTERGHHLTPLTPTSIAAKYGFYQVVQVLHEVGADVHQESGEITPLILAIAFNKEEVVTLLCNLGADVNKKVGLKKTLSPLRVAVELGFHEIITILHKFGASTQEVIENELTLVDHAFFLNHHDTVHLLSTLGANVSYCSV